MLPLLRTKTTLPPVGPRQISRPRLLELVTEGARRALTLIIAPAGFGKTTLAAAWAQSGQMPAAWLSLQPGDRPGERFLAYLVQALQTISPRLGQTTLALMQSGSLEGALFALVNDLAMLEGDIALILDDYHHIDAAATGEIVQFLLTNHPATFHLILTTRSTPSLNLARLYALDQVTEISAAELRFSDAEVRDFLEHSLGVHLSVDQLTRLTQSTEGWAVGLQLAGLALGRQPESLTIPLGQEQIFDYLAEEVLRREPPAVQDFLKKTALFERFCVPLCDAVLAPQGKSLPSQEMIAHIGRANLFLVQLDPSAAWYRYHALFADFLRRQLPAGQAPPLYRAASLWFEENGLLDDAIHMAIHAADYERAAGLLEGHYLDMVQRGEQAALLEWVSLIPPALLEGRPRLWLAKGWAGIVSLDTGMTMECIDKAEALITPGEAGERLLGEAKLLRILAQIFTGQTPSTAEISSIFPLLDEQDDFLRSLLYFNLGLHHAMCGETALAIEVFNKTLGMSKSLNNPLMTIIAYTQLGETRQIRGALGLAERTFLQAIRYAKETFGEHTFLLGMPYISYAELLREQNRFDEALRFAERGITGCQVWQPVASLDGHIAIARIHAAQGRWEEAFDRLEGALQVAESSSSKIDDIFAAVQLARLALFKGDLPRARYYLQLFDLEKAREGFYFHLYEMMNLMLYRAGVMELGADPAPANLLCEELASLAAESERRERVTPVIEASILLAYAHQAAGRETAAAESLSRALALGAQSGYLRIFADEGQKLFSLLERCRSQIHAPRSYLDNILALMRRENAIRLSWAARPAHSAVPKDQLPLTRRELDILSLLAAGKSNQEIAAERVLALNTVKKHVANILSKLGVANRTQAVMLARKLGWVE